MAPKRLLQGIALSIFLLFFSLSTALAQNKTITGKVTDSKDSAPLVGATIQVKGSRSGTTTGTSGDFTITVPASAKILAVSAVGYENQDVPIDSDNLSVLLVASTSNLDEVVVVGYGTARKKDLTGAVTKVSAKEFNTGVVSNPLQQIQGKVAGLVIVQPGGDPNADLTVRLRGATSLTGQPPLVVIDGIALDDFNQAINTLNPTDVESYDILRDASAAAIYGSRGANGVIIITTKKGKSGRTQVDYAGSIGISNISRKLDMLSADDWRKAIPNEWRDYLALDLANNPNPDSLAQANLTALDKGVNVDWVDEITRPAVFTSHSIAIGGGTGNFNYRASVGYVDQQGVVVNSGKKMTTARFTANQKGLDNRLNVQYNLNASTTKRDFLPDQRNTSQGVTDGGSAVFNLAYNYLPVYPVKNANGSYFQIIDQDLENPLARLKDVYSKRQDNFYQGSVKVDYEFFSGFKLGTFGAMSRYNDVFDYFEPKIPEKNNSPAAVKANANKAIFNGDIHANYRKEFGAHSINVTGVYEYNKFVNDGFVAGARGYIVPELLNNNLGANSDIRSNDIGSYKGEVKLVSFLGRVEYNFDDRFLVTANFRRDGSSKFGANHRWGDFPSISAAWTMSNEGFMKDIPWLNFLKLRASYGLTGNQDNIGSYAYQLLYGTQGLYYDNGNLLQSYGVSQENNPDLKWEVRKSMNFGIDFTLLNNRLSGTLDVFSDKTQDMLFTYDLPQPPFLTNRVTANAATATNKGVELSLNGTIIRNNNFSWNALFNVGTLRNRITNLNGNFKGTELVISRRLYGYADGRGLSNAYISVLQPGYTAGAFWLWEFAGLDATGKQLFNDYDENGKVVGTTRDPKDDDRVFIDPTPKFTWGFTNNFTYKDFDLSFAIRGVQGQKVFSNTILNLATITRLAGNNILKEGLTNGITEQPQPSTYWLKNASYMRMDNATLGYNFKMNSKVVQYLRVFFAANNLFVVTPYKGIDPEIKVDGDRRYIDRNYYPKTRSFTFGINMSL
ncbi:TonB-dependent receptor [Agriterribacter sp.]|uniref:SusC/RagA family TonB-linked outer membrane protein n=1 Tax=Agriterribacter sp. TaxID=2821509 RepID=UPI002BED1E1B|nr:TonB-dependent receptor [Agriterribacter sp.]HTN08676.1 TonB-dependent receptor [Agriterribacter sp.]